MRANRIDSNLLPSDRHNQLLTLTARHFFEHVALGNHANISNILTSWLFFYLIYLQNKQSMSNIAPWNCEALLLFSKNSGLDPKVLALPLNPCCYRSTCTKQTHPKSCQTANQPTAVGTAPTRSIHNHLTPCRRPENRSRQPLDTA